MTRAEFQDRVLILCRRHDCSQTSAYRTEKRNKLVGGHSRSQHLSGDAIDLVLDEDTVEKRAAITRDAKAAGLYVHEEPDHLHLSRYYPVARPPQGLTWT